MATPVKPNIYNIPASYPFMDVLAQSLIKETVGQPEKLANTLILLPTRRACRNLQEAFLKQSENNPIILPRLHPIGDIDEEELLINAHATNIAEIKPAMPPLKRQILIAQLIGKLDKLSKTTEQNMRLAAALGQLMDEVYTEDLDLSNLPNVVDREAFADQWQITVDFLSILSTTWPTILEAEGMIDAADRRNKLIKALNNYWQHNPPTTRIIAAGSTGSIPATMALLKTVATLPNGCLILPALDQFMNDKAWDLVEEGHPQKTIKNLLAEIECDRNDVHLWDNLKTDNIRVVREKFISHVMAPPDYTHEWQKVHIPSEQKSALEADLQNVSRLDCDTPQDEAQIIALLMREVLETPQKTAALVTSNRYLARRVSTLCKRWNIDVDDSGGAMLGETNLGVYLQLILKACLSDVRPVSLLALLKHQLCHGNKYPNFRKNIRALEKNLLRGISPPPGFDGIKNLYNQKINDPYYTDKIDESTLKFIEHLENNLQEFITLINSNECNFSEILIAHLKVAEALSTTTEKQGAEILWVHEAGETAANFFSELQNYTHQIPSCSGHDYFEILKQFMSTITVRPAFGTHPRLMILGQLEARLLQADRVILSGLNEGNWPPDAGHDPWMSRPMRAQFGLPPPERSITLAAHDFVQGFCGKEVFMTRAKREDGTLTVPARWLMRMDTFMQAINVDVSITSDTSYLQYAKMMDKIDGVKPIERPNPKPPLAARPNKLSVTKIETWMKDPYAIYAGSILKLRALDPLEKEIGPMERGNILHDVLEKFNNTYPKDIPNSAQDDFIQIAKETLETSHYDPNEWNFWLPRMIRLSEWYVPYEKQWRTQARFGKSEIKGEISFKAHNNFTLNGRADRIDYLNDGAIALIDYKSGGSYPLKKMKNGELPQLPLEALIVKENGFDDANIKDKTASYIGYWKMTGGLPAGEINAIDTDLVDIVENTKTGLFALIETFNDVETPYLALPSLDNAPAYNDYEHLERVKEWAALGENESEVA